MSIIEIGRIGREINEITDGVEVYHEYHNAGEKEIKYITFCYLAYNAVNDIVECTVHHTTEFHGKLTGPIPSKHVGSVTWPCTWYNRTVRTVVISKLIIQYMDNTEEEIDGKDIVDMRDEGSVYYRDVVIPQRKAAEERKAKEAAEAQERKIVNDAFKKVYGDSWKRPKEADLVAACSALFFEFKNDEKTLLKVLDKVIDEIKRGAGIGHASIRGYIIGDYIEKEFFSNEELIKRAVTLWKEAIGQHNKEVGPGSPFFDKMGRRKTVKKYADKIRKYDPEYTEPQWPNR